MVEERSIAVDGDRRVVDVMRGLADEKDRYVDSNAIVLPESRSTINVIRGLYVMYRPDGAYADSDFIENVGVSPDIVFTHTVADFRAGYVGYTKAFSDVIMEGAIHEILHFA